MIDIEKIVARGYITLDEADEVMAGGNISKMHLKDKDGETESIWVAVLTGKEHFSAATNVGDDVHIVLANHALTLLPLRSWGTVLSFKHSGTFPHTLNVTEEHAKRLLSIYPEYEKQYEEVLSSEEGKTDADE